MDSVEPDIIVVSDLHISAGPLDDFDAELERHFCDFLDQLNRRSCPVEMVINGDFLDFVQAPPWEGDSLSSTTTGGIPLSFTEQQSLEKLNAIRGQHPDLFKALGRFLMERPDNSLVILPGNHDADFFWNGVQEKFKNAVCEQTSLQPDRIRFHLDTVYRPETFRGVWIEHGHQYDFLNSYFVNGQARWSRESPPITKDRNGQWRLLECTGTRFLVRFLNRLDKEYPYVDNVKPFGRFLSIFGANIASAPGSAIMVLNDLIEYVLKTLVSRPGDLLGIEDGIGPQTQPLLVRTILSLPSAQAQDIQRRLQDRGFPEFEIPLAMFVRRQENAENLLTFLRANPDLCEPLIPVRQGELALGRGFSVNETKELIRAARGRLHQEAGVTAVVMGHTHETVLPETLPYFNTGCWTRYYRFADDEPIRDWKLLRNPDYGLFPYQLNYVEIRPASEVPVQLRTFAQRAQS